MLLERLPRFARATLALFLLAPAVMLAPAAARGWAVLAIATGTLILVLLPASVRHRLRTTRAGTENSETSRRSYLVPVQVPPPPRLLVGREAETASILRSLRPVPRSGQPLVVISGPAGIGKSSLALRVAHQALPWFPRGGALFVAVGRRPYGRQLVDEILASFVDAMQGPQQTVPEDPADCVRAYRELSLRRAPLVVLDDVADARTVRALLPASPLAAVLVTCRDPLPDLGEHHAIRLGPLGGAAARELLTAVLGDRARSEPEAVDTIVTSAGGHPMALQLASASLAARRHWALDAAVDRMGGLADDRREPFSGALDISYALLPEQERAALRWLGMVDDQSFAPWMLAALLNEDDREPLGPEQEEAAWHLVERLTHARLIERQDHDFAGVTRFRVPEHVHVYARERLAAETTPTQRTAARRRLDRARSRRRGEQPGDIVQEAAELAHDRGQLSSALNAVRGALALARENHTAAWDARSRSGLAAAERARVDRRIAGARADEAAALATLAELHAELGGVEDAWELAVNALVLDEAVARPRALRCLGRLQRRLRRLDEAESTLADAEQAAGDTGDDGERIRVLRELAVAQAMGGRPADGVATAERARRWCADHPERGRWLAPGVGWAYGFALTECRRFEDADRVLAAGDTLAQELGQLLWVAWIGQQRARVGYRAGRYEYGRDLAFRAMDTFTEIRHRYGTAYCRLVAGRTYLAQHSPREALPVLEEALHTFNACGDRWIEARTAGVLAGALVDLGRPDEARRVLRQAEEIVHELGVDDERARIRAELAKLEPGRARWSRLTRRNSPPPRPVTTRRRVPVLPSGAGFWWSEPVGLVGPGGAGTTGPGGPEGRPGNGSWD